MFRVLVFVMFKAQGLMRAWENLALPAPHPTDPWPRLAQELLTQNKLAAKEPK